MPGPPACATISGSLPASAGQLSSRPLGSNYARSSRKAANMPESPQALGITLTFDTNCLIDLELGAGGISHLRGLLAAHDANRITVAISAAAASERLPGGLFAPNFSAFQQRASRLSARPIILLRPLCYFDITYLDWSLLADEHLAAQEEAIHRVLFPTIEFKWRDHATKHGIQPETPAASSQKELLRWRNKKCDTLAMWCHIHYGNAVFVTRDSNFLKASKKKALIALGARQILTPSEAAALLRQG